jgi:phospholipase/lecithinase/hemolysin
MQVLYSLGARKMVLFELGPIGCYPLVGKRGEQNGKCLQELNTILAAFNAKLYYKLTDIASSFEGTTFIVAQTFKLIYDMVENPSKYGKPY